MDMPRRTEMDFPRWIITALAIAAFALIAVFFIFLLWQSLPIFKAEGWNFLTGRDWWAGETYGALPMIFGSLMVTGLALAWVLPLALAGAIVTSEYLSPKWRLAVKSSMELFAGIPGIVYGLLGVTVLAVWVKDIFGLIDGNTILTASLLLGVMVLPTIMTLAEDALHAVPGRYREASTGLGLTKLQTTVSVALPQARKGIFGAIFLGLGRAMGETIAVMLVIGGLDRIPSPWYDIFSPGQSIPAKLGREAAEALGGDLHWSALMALSLILFLMVTGITTLGQLFLKRAQA